MTPVLAARDVRLRYGHGFALDVPALDVRPGELMALIGPNGSGKSTLLRVLGLLQAPDAGEIRFRGEAVSVAGGLGVRRRMAAVFQPPLLVDGTVRDNVALGLRFRGVPAAARARRVERWLARFGLAGIGGRHARTLSGGQAQRVALARALVLEPDVLLLDEPFAALDPATRADLVPELAAILREDRVTTVMVTHDRGEAQMAADRVAVLLDGRLRQVGETARVFQAPGAEDVARFVGVETILAGCVVGGADGVVRVDVGAGTIEVAGTAPAGAAVRVGIRPEDVTLTRAGEGGPASSARNQRPATVVRITAGSPARVLVDCGFPLVAALTPRSVTDLGLVPGTRVGATFKASAAHLMVAPPSGSPRAEDQPGPTGSAADRSPVSAG